MSITNKYVVIQGFLTEALSDAAVESLMYMRQNMNCTCSLLKTPADDPDAFDGLLSDPSFTLLLGPTDHAGIRQYLKNNAVGWRRTPALRLEDGSLWLSEDGTPYREELPSSSSSSSSSSSA
jgi:hypothetical protein